MSVHPYTCPGQAAAENFHSQQVAGGVWDGKVCLSLHTVDVFFHRWAQLVL